MDNIETTHKDKEDKKKSYWLSIMILLGLVVFTFYFLLKDQNIGELISTTKTVNPIYIVLGLLAVLLFISCEALNFKIIFNTFGQKVPFLRSLKYSFIGFYFSSITPSASGGQPMQMYYMKKDNINISFSSLTILITIVVYQITMVCYAILAFMINPSFIIQKASSIWILLLYGFVINIVIIIFIVCAIYSKNLVYKVVNGTMKFLHKIRIVKDIDKASLNLQHQVEEYKQSVLVIRKNKIAVIKVFLITIVQLTAMYSVPFFVYKAFGLSNFSAMNIIFLQAILTIAVSSLPLPGAVGASEGGFIMLFKTFFSSGIITSAMLLSRGISFYVFLLISGVVVVIAHIISKRNDGNNKKDNVNVIRS